MLDDKIYVGMDVAAWNDVTRTTEVHATLVTAVGGGPLRTLVTGGRRTHSGPYSSAKTNRSQPWKAPAEVARMMVCEVDSAVETYLAQPHRLDFRVESERLQFFPDLKIVYRSGATAVERIRSKAEVTRGLGESRAESLARHAYGLLGWEFRVLDPGKAEEGRAVGNARRIQLDRWTIVDARQMRRALDALDRAGGQTAFGVVVDAMGGDAAARAQLHALIIRAHVAIDLDAIFDDDTAVRRGPVAGKGN